MAYNVKIEGFEGQNIEAKNSFWSGSKLLINGQPAPKGNKRGEMLLTRNDGRQVTAFWKPQGGGFDVPQLVVDNQTVSLAEPLKWYHLVWSSLPIALVFVGGLLGGIAGVIGFSINAAVFRSQMSGVLKYLISGIVSVVAVVAYFIAAMLFNSLINWTFAKS